MGTRSVKEDRYIEAMKLTMFPCQPTIHLSLLTTQEARAGQDGGSSDLWWSRPSGALWWSRPSCAGYVSDLGTPVDSFTLPLHSLNGRQCLPLGLCKGSVMGSQKWWESPLAHNAMGHWAIPINTKIIQSQKRNTCQLEAISHTLQTALLPPG